MAHFLQDVEGLRERARRSIEAGPVTESYRGDKQQTIHILNQALATEIVCVLRYLHHYFMATGVHGKSVADEFKEHADAEREHADGIAERIQQLGGKPDFNSRNLLERSAAQYVEGDPGTRPLDLQPEEERGAAAEDGRHGQKHAAEDRSQRQVAGRGSAVPPEHEPGTTGRPTRRRP